MTTALSPSSEEPVWRRYTTNTVASLPRVAFQGERGAYGEDAIMHRWRHEARTIPCWSFGDVVLAVTRGTAHYGVLPISNTVVGAIRATHDLLAQSGHLTIVDEISVPICHALLAPAGTAIEHIRFVTSHPVALAQCQHFLHRHPHIVPQHAYDTAGAARDVAARNQPYESAIASRRAGEWYKLEVLAEGIQDVADNFTRFAVVALADTNVRR